MASIPNWRKHGLSRDLGPGSTYNSWRGMRDRCRRHPTYKGVKVCSRWNDFNKFIEDMGIRPSAKHDLDRYPNPDGNYEPNNCRWIHQSINRGNGARRRINGKNK